MPPVDHPLAAFLTWDVGLEVNSAVAMKTLAVCHIHPMV